MADARLLLQPMGMVRAFH